MPGAWAIAALAVAARSGDTAMAQAAPAEVVVYAAGSLHGALGEAARA